MKSFSLFFLILCFHFSFGEGQKEIDSLNAVIKNTKADSTRFDAYSTLGDIYMDVNNYDSCIHYRKLSLDLAIKINDPDYLIPGLNRLGKSYAFFGNREKSFQYFLESMKEGEKINTTEGKMSCLVNYLDISDVYDNLKDVGKALEIRIKALNLWKEIEKMSKKTDGKRMFDFSVDESEWEIMHGAIYDGLGRSYLNLNNKDSALFYFSKAEKIWEENGLEEFQMMTLLNKSALLINDNKLEEALKNYKKILDYSRKDSLFLPETTPLTSIALIYKFQHKYDDAIKIYYEILRLGKRAKSYDDIQTAYEGLSESYQKKNEYKLAYVYRDSLISFKDSLSRMENQTNIAEMKVKFETSEKEKQIKILEQDNKLKDLAAEKEKLTRRLLIGGIAMMMLLAFLVIFYFVKKQKTEKFIADEKINTLLREQELKSMSDALEVQENERRRIAYDLHDRLGSMLSTVKLYFSSVEENIDKLKEQNLQQYNKANVLLDEACEEVRKISHNLVSGELVKFGLTSALNQMITTIQDAGHLKIKMFSLGMENRLEGQVEIALYRIIQELMNNILKHSKASEVVLQLNKTENNLNIIIEDNGVGFDTTGATARDGMGLKNIESRVNKLNGKLFVDSAKGRGTTTIIDIPV